jgi:hypothetical protein
MTPEQERQIQIGNGIANVGAGLMHLGCALMLAVPVGIFILLVILMMIGLASK